MTAPCPPPANSPNPPPEDRSAAKISTMPPIPKKRKNRKPSSHAISGTPKKLKDRLKPRQSPIPNNHPAETQKHPPTKPVRLRQACAADHAALSSAVTSSFTALTE